MILLCAYLAPGYLIYTSSFHLGCLSIQETEKAGSQLQHPSKPGKKPARPITRETAPMDESTAANYMCAPTVW